MRGKHTLMFLSFSLLPPLSKNKINLKILKKNYCLLGLQGGFSGITTSTCLAYAHSASARQVTAEILARWTVALAGAMSLVLSLPPRP